MAEPTVVNYISKLLDNTKDFVDDLLEDAKDVEKGTRKQLGKARDKVKDADIDALREKAQKLTEQLDKLVAVDKKK